MSRRHWMHIPAPVGTLIILGVMLVAVVLISPLESDKLGDSVRSEKSTASGQGNTAPEQEVPIEVPRPQESVSASGTDSSSAQDGTSNAETEEQRAQADLEAQQGMALWAFWMFVASAGSVVVATTAVILVYRTLSEARKTTEAVIETNKEAARAAKAAADTVGLMQRAERAYVTISHKPPGLDFQDLDGHAKVIVDVKNCGRTPATVTAVHLELQKFGVENPPPDHPVYHPHERHSKAGSFLVTNSNFLRVQIMPIHDREENGEFWLFGYVDYVDIFDQRHRGGYARVYITITRAETVETGTPPSLAAAGTSSDMGSAISWKLMNAPPNATPSTIRETMKGFTAV